MPNRSSALRPRRERPGGQPARGTRPVDEHSSHGAPPDAAEARQSASRWERPRRPRAGVTRSRGAAGHGSTFRAAETSGRPRSVRRRAATTRRGHPPSAVIGRHGASREARRARGAMVGWHPGAVVRAVARDAGVRPAGTTTASRRHHGNHREDRTYEAPGRPGSPVELKDRYDNFIGGAWVPPETGEYRENLTPATGEPFCEVAYSAPADIELGARRRARRQGRVGQDLRRRPRRRAERHRRRDRGQPRDARGRRELRERQAGARDARRRPAAGDRPLPLLRRRDPRRGGADLRDRRADRRLPLPASRSASSARSSRSTSRC